MDSSTTSIIPSKNVSASVQVALRVRPQGNREKLEGSRVCTSVVPNEPQVTIGGDRSFTYDYVFDQPTTQQLIFDSCIHRLVAGLFDGYNATVLAYGQTGSGKTYTMGTAFDTGLIKEGEVGVIPRAISFVFEQIANLKREAQENGILEPTFDVAVQFIELYNEEVIDLLSDDRASSANVRIHEDNRGEIYLHGVTAKPVQDLHSTMEILKNGALNRTVASTNMNEQSSRSHAIFSLHIKQQRVIPSEGEDMGTGATEVEVISAKFHFVDLAGSERLKRTGATGDRAKEGISINSGLLALGNVISALGGANGKVGHVPYRDSKLTRLLQDSLGGNSQTLMIACVSPSDSDFVETLNTMKYANRAKNIKNKVVANQDKSSKLIGELRGKIASLESELLEYKQGRRSVDANGLETISDQYHENVMLTAEVNQLRFRVKALQETNEILRGRNVELMAAKDAVLLSGVSGDGSREIMSESGEQLDPVQATIRNYLEELEKTRSALYESHATSDQLRKEVARWKAQALAGGTSISATALSADSSPFSPNSFSQRQLIDEAKADLEKMKKVAGPNTSIVNDSTSDYASHGETMDDCEDGTSNDADDLESDDDEAEGDDMVFEETRESCMLRDNLNDLQTEIGIKERLISELERSERRLAEVRLTYEKKLTELSLRIKQTEAERDRILSDGTPKKNDKASQEQAKRIRDEYERKLTDMKNEFRKLQMVEKEHKRMQARQERERQELVRYQAELKELKKVKVDLMKKIRDELKKAQQVSMSNSKRLAKLDKEARIKENKIRLLESKDKQREEYMKRTNEEISRLRKAQREQVKQQARPVSTPLRGGPVVRQNPRQTPRRNGQPPPEMTFSPKHAKIKWNMIEKKLTRLITQKQTVGKMEEELARLLKERHTLVDEISHLEKKFASSQMLERDDIMEEIDGVRQKLSYIQDQITEVQTSIVDVDTTKENGDETDDADFNSIEAILEHCSNIVEAKYLLQHLFSHSLEQGISAANCKASNRELEAKVQHLEQQSYINEQLLSTVIEDKSLVSDLDSIENGMRRKSRSPSLQSMRAGSTSPSITDNSEPTLQPYKARRRTATADELLYPSPDTATPSSEKEKDGSEEKLPQEEEKKEKKKTKQGRIVSVRNDPGTRTRVVTRTHTLEGHSKAILSCAATEDHLLTGSKDRTAKLWDLSTGQEVRTLGVHPNSVHSVKFIPNSHLALSISMYQVRVWDIRSDNCIRVLHSSGQIIDGDGGPVGSRQNTVPFLETVINAAEVDPFGRLLFTSFAGDVRIWNLEKWASFGRLVGASHSPRSEVSCLAVATGEDEAPFVFTGSRDHYVKMYEVNPAGEGVHEAAVEFSPPHYDNVTCTLAYNGNLFTASKDFNIMKFSLTDYKRDHLELKTHNGYVQGMCMIGINSGRPLLTSVCREGTIKFWDIGSTRRMKLVEEISKAHSGGINGVCCNNYLMFTASSDQTVGFWKLNMETS